MRVHGLALTLLLLIGTEFLRAEDVDYSQFVNPFIGSENAACNGSWGGGDIFMGAALPFGMVKLGLDTYEGPWNSSLNGGYTPSGGVTAISMLHESGTGGAPKLGVVSQFPLATLEGVNLLDNRTYLQTRVGKDEASVGYFKTRLNSGITIELAATRHAGLHRYHFPTSTKHVLIDLSHYLPSPTRTWDSQFYTGGEIHIGLDNKTYTGSTSIAGGWNVGAPVTVYVCGEFDKAASSADVFKGKNTFPTSRHFRSFNDNIVPQPSFVGSSASSGPLNDRVGALFSWTGPDHDLLITSRVGVSFMSVSKACEYKDSELSWDLNATAHAARSEWNRDVFSKVRVDTSSSANETRLFLLYSSLYFMHLIPSEREKENPLWSSDEPYWDDFYAIWDLFRNQVSFWHLTQPAYYESMIRALIDMWRHEGFLPDARSGNYNGLVQGGSDADNMLADAYVKGLRGSINWSDGYLAVKKDAEYIPYYDYNELDPYGSVKEGRGSLKDWLELGYVSADNKRSVSKSLEYSLNDFAMYQIAAGEAPEDQDKYLKRSAGWQCIWDPEASSHNFTGFVAPRFANGTFSKNNPARCSDGECGWDAETYEGTAFQYSFFVPHDVERLITLMGGPDAFERRLDYVFLPNTRETDLGANGLGITSINNVGDEPDFNTPYLYHYLNKQWKSVERSRQLANQYYFNTANGIPGNSDSGALNCWLVWQMLGLYPIVTTPVYLLSSPWFDDINITVNHNRTLRVRAMGRDDGEGRTGYFVQSVTINGQQWAKNWFEHGDIMDEGGEIVFTLGYEKVEWESAEVPPSPGHFVPECAVPQ